MTLSKDLDAQGGLESVSKPERVASLTGIRAVAALLVMFTHAAYTTGKYTHGYVGLVYSHYMVSKEDGTPPYLQKRMPPQYLSALSGRDLGW